MSVINIVMIEPEIPQNTGNVARTCAATGARLHLVGPMGFAVDDKKLKRAGLDYWHFLDITYYESSAEFFEKNSGPYFFFTTKARQLHCFRKGNKGTSRRAAARKSRKLRPHTHGGRNKVAQPLEFGRDRGL